MDKLSYQVSVLQEADRYEQANIEFKKKFSALNPSIWIPPAWSSHNTHSQVTNHITRLTYAEGQALTETTMLPGVVLIGPDFVPHIHELNAAKKRLYHHVQNMRAALPLKAGRQIVSDVFHHRQWHLKQVFRDILLLEDAVKSVSISWSVNEKTITTLTPEKLTDLIENKLDGEAEKEILRNQVQNLDVSRLAIIRPQASKLTSNFSSVEKGAKSTRIRMHSPVMLAGNTDWPTLPKKEILLTPNTLDRKKRKDAVSRILLNDYLHLYYTTEEGGH